MFKSHSKVMCRRNAFGSNGRSFCPWSLVDWHFEREVPPERRAIHKNQGLKIVMIAASGTHPVRLASF